MLEDCLSLAGIASVVAGNGREALAALRHSRPCLILLDLCMPIMDGWQFRKEQQQLADRGLADIPVVLLSALANCADESRVMGAVGSLQKPIDLDQLLDIVRRYVPGVTPPVLPTGLPVQM